MCQELVHGSVPWNLERTNAMLPHINALWIHWSFHGSSINSGPRCRISIIYMGTLGAKHGIYVNTGELEE